MKGEKQKSSNSHLTKNMRLLPYVVVSEHGTADVEEEGERRAYLIGLNSGRDCPLH